MIHFPQTPVTNNHKLDITTLEGWLWEAACKIRGRIDAPKYKDYILPLIFLKRLSDVFDDEVLKLERKYGKRETVEALLSEDHSLVRFYLPKESRWNEVAKNDFNLSPSRYVAQDGRDETLPLEDAVALLKEAEEERREADEQLKNVLGGLGLDLDR